MISLEDLGKERYNKTFDQTFIGNILQERIVRIPTATTYRMIVQTFFTCEFVAIQVN